MSDKIFKATLILRWSKKTYFDPVLGYRVRFLQQKFESKDHQIKWVEIQTEG